MQKLDTNATKKIDANRNTEVPISSRPLLKLNVRTLDIAARFSGNWLKNTASVISSPRALEVFNISHDLDAVVRVLGLMSFT